MAETLILVDENDNVVGFGDKEKCHDSPGTLHRAIAAFVFNEDGKLLIQQRSRFKRLWPLIWDNTASSHPYPNENYQSAAERRLLEELGFKCPLKYVFKFTYHAPYKDTGAEREMCAVLVGQHDGKVVANAKEVADWKYVDSKGLKANMERHPEKYTPWFIIAFNRLWKDHPDVLDL